LLLVAAACGSDSNDDAASRTTTTTSASTPTSRATSTTIPSALVSTSDDCPGIGVPSDDADITWIKDGGLWSMPSGGGERRCLLRATYPNLEWGGAADRVRVGSKVVVGGTIRDLAGDLIGFSRPTGKAMLARENGTLEKLSLEDAPTLSLEPFFNDDIDQQHDVLYHPAGTAIVAVMPRGERPGLLMATNLGEDPRWLVDNETADELQIGAFTETGALVFAADHGDHHDLHRLDLQTNELTTVLESEVGFGRIAASAYDEGNLAASERVGGPEPLGRMWVQRDGEVVDVSSTAVAHGAPLGWLPDGSLLVAVYEDDVDCCDVFPFDLYVLRGTTATLLERQVDSAAVRAVLPPPPPPPALIDEAAPA
jgi:hypothetical protein